MIITIDGTSGSGKSTVAEIFANNLNLNILNTGSLYRTITKECLSNDIVETNLLKIIKIAENIDFTNIDQEKLYTEEISKMVTVIAKIPEVRSIVRHFQIKFSKTENVVIEGRDIGTVVFPNAEIKFFITATAEKRAERRFNQLKITDNTVNYNSILQNIIERDKQDKNRTYSPLKIPNGAIVIDTTDMSIDEVVTKMENEYRQRI